MVSGKIFCSRWLPPEQGFEITTLTALSVNPGPGKLYPVSRPTFGRLFKSLLPFKIFLLGLLLSLLVLPGLNAQWLAGYSFRKEITIPPPAFPESGTLTNFPVLIDITHDDLRSVSNGGQVNSNLGWDIVFSDADGITPLNHETESYNPSSGRIVAWVQVPLLDGISGNTIYLYFTTPTPVDLSTPDTWDPNAYVAVYHLQDNDYSDATASGFDGSATGTTNSLYPNNIIEDGQDFEYGNGSDQVALPSFDVSSNSLTISAWMRPESFDQGDARIVSKANGSNVSQHWWMLSTKDVGADYRLRFRQKAGASNTTYPNWRSIFQPVSRYLDLCKCCV